ncbi:class I SAM-dependent methyltransferase [Dyella sp. GSA-30]|uniref:class I SAM-dependent methyltransferase n=1 Tax=Dyella sp. GSA-30 TaxID=2994496 RepID=UPI002491419F|nr:class I SAM-dependent methyltransferase [Dyella sp. GSA-30]BDU20291.1 S-adenosyl-L-methionine-dependent methyltransferase [Dyella sp. GSA-30]
MKSGQASKTAEAVAAVRARHRIYDSPLIVDDPWAIELTSAAWRRICRSRMLSWLVFGHLLAALRPVQGNILGRARYVEEKLAQASGGDIQYVILGAGLDSYALRQNPSPERLHIWEVDHPDSQAQKLAKLKKLAVAIPDNVRFIPVDLQATPLAEALGTHGFPFQSTSFISLLGVSYYINETALFALIGDIAKYFASGSQLVLDIRVSRQFIATDYLATFEKTERFTRKRGEPMISDFDPGSFIARAQSLGLKLRESLSPDAQRARYFASRHDGLIPSPEIYFLHFEVP